MASSSCSRRSPRERLLTKLSSRTRCTWAAATPDTPPRNGSEPSRPRIRRSRRSTCSSRTTLKRCGPHSPSRKTNLTFCRPQEMISASSPKKAELGSSPVKDLSRSGSPTSSSTSRWVSRNIWRSTRRRTSAVGDWTHRGHYRITRAGDP